MNIILKGSEITLTTADDFSSAKAVRIHNATAGGIVVTHKDVANTTIGTCTVGAGATEVFVKNPTDTLEAASGVLAVAVGFSI